MKQLVKIFTVLFVAIAATMPAVAQQQQQKGRKGGQPRTEKAPSREVQAQMQARHIAKDLALTDDAAKKFEQAYTECQQELCALGKEVRTKAETEEEAKKAIESRFERSQKILDIRKKFYKKYSEFLTQKQIARVYDLEKGMKSKFRDNRQRKATADKQAKRPKHQQPGKPGKPAKAAEK